MASTTTNIPCDVKNFEVADMGKKRIEWANQSMKVLQIIRKEFIKNQPLKGIRVSVMRLPQVHDTVKQGIITPAIEIAREKGVSAYVGEGRNRWAAAHISDVARLYRLALERNEAGAKYHGVAEEGVPMRDIAEAIGRRLKLPVKSISAEEASAHFGWLAMFAARDLLASSEKTRKKLGWNPTGPGLIADLEELPVSGR